MNRKMAVRAVVLAVAGLVLAQSASALHIWRYPGYHTVPGGEFTVFGTGYEANGYDAKATYSDPTYGVGFQTFCLEASEDWAANPAGFTVDPVAKIGGGGINPDPISLGTEWLYDQFSRGVLLPTDYDYIVGAGRAGDAYQLQMAFWWLEDEITADLSGNSFVQLAAAALGKTPNDLKDNAVGAYPVAVINFTDVTGAPRQSMLVRVPDGGVTVLLLGLSLVGIAAIRRRMA